MSLTVSAVTLKPNETLNPGTKRWNCTKVCRGAAVGLVLAWRVPRGWDLKAACALAERGGSVSLLLPFLFCRGWSIRHQYGGDDACVGGELCLGEAGVCFDDSYLHSCIWQTLSHCLHYIQGIHVIMISWVFRVTCSCNWLESVFVYVSAFIHAVTFDLSASRLDLNVLVLFNMVS